MDARSADGTRTRARDRAMWVSGCGDAIVALVKGPDEGTVQPTPDFLCFATDELHAVHDRAERLGATIVPPGIEERPWGEVSFYCFDPDGNRLCFVDASTLFLGRGAAWQ